MKYVSFKQQFDIKIGESIEIPTVKLLVKLKNLSRLMIPKKPDQFIIVLTLDWEGKMEDIGLDGDFSFTNRIVKVDWMKFSIQIHDMDMMAKFAVLSVSEI